MNKIYNNKYAFLYQKPRKFWLILIIFILLLNIILAYTTKEYTYDFYETKGLVICEKSNCEIKTIIPSAISINKILINNKITPYEIKSLNLKFDEENYLTYNEIYFTTPNTYQNNEVLTLKFYYNKQRIISKIKNIMF